MPFYSHGCKVTVSYDFTNGQCQVLFNRDDLPAKTNFRFILHRDGGKYTLFLNEDGRMDSPRIESNLQGRTEVNHGACPQQYAEFMQSVAQIVAELFPVHTQAPKNAGEEGAYTDNSAHAAVERSIALGRFAQASNSREMTFG